MFLLIPSFERHKKRLYCTLHSTMFLLILLRRPKCRPDCFFTFHYVSINTGICASSFVNPILFTFHYVSINTTTPNFFKSSISHFTFHYVSINTCRVFCIASTTSFFTFHYVSINTMCIWILPDGYRTLHSTMFLLILTKTLHKELNIFLYIPLCFY